ncbi:acyloxyacyl hydrolase [Xylophilus sp. GW821-FHT01B05]
MPTARFHVFAAAAAATVLLTAALPAQADPTAKSGVYLQYERTPSDTKVATVGITAPIQWSSTLWGTKVGAYWDLYYSRLAIDSISEHMSLIGLVPSFRLRLNQGASPWFADAGVGLTYVDGLYHTDRKEFSTRFNFASHLGVGYSFGTNFQHEVQLRVQHISNAAIRRPNPGENFVQLRYGYTF